MPFDREARPTGFRKKRDLGPPEYPLGGQVIPGRPKRKPKAAGGQRHLLGSGAVGQAADKARERERKRRKFLGM